MVLSMEKTKYLQDKLQEYLFASQKLTADAVVAKVILDNLAKFPEVYLKQIAQEAQVAESTVTKFCHKIGYRSFKELREDIILNKDIEMIDIMLEHLRKDSIDDAITQMLEEEAKMMKYIFSIFDDDLIQTISGILRKAGKGMILAPSYMNESITFFEQIMRRRQIDFYRLARSSESLLIDNYLSGENDRPVLIFSLTSEWVLKNKQTLRLIREKGNPVILFTCADITEKAANVDIVFYLGEEDFVGNQTSLVSYLFFKCLLLKIAAGI